MKDVKVELEIEDDVIREMEGYALAQTGGSLSGLIRLVILQQFAPVKFHEELGKLLKERAA